MKVRNVGSVDVTLPDGTPVAPGGTVDVPSNVAEQLMESGTWQRVNARRGKDK